MRRGAVAALPLLSVLALLTACNEKLDGTAACPLTCVDQAAQINTVDLDAVTTASTVLGGLGTGTETRLLLSSRSDTLDTRVVIRFDTLPGVSARSATDTSTVTTLQYVDSVYLRMVVDSAAAKLANQATISVYDVDTNTGSDTAVATLAPLFTPARLVASRTFAAGTLVDSVGIRIPNAFILTKAANKQRVRLGLQISGPGSASVRIASKESGYPPTLVMRNYPDTTHSPLRVVPFSATPAGNSSIASNLSDFTLFVKGVATPSGNLLAIGGLPGTRAYFLFNVPSRITDSSLVVRATLLLTQVPSSSPDPTDSMTVQPLLVTAAPTITDPVKAAQIVAPPTSVPLAGFRTLPSSSGTREVEIAPAFGYWATQTVSVLPRAIALASSQEDYSPQQALFYGPSATNPNFRPKLRVSYTLRSRIGIP